jgi:D-glycero-alpha-D-manno-heptose-7-phosphate kinase
VIPLTGFAVVVDRLISYRISEDRHFDPISFGKFLKRKVGDNVVRHLTVRARAPLRLGLAGGGTDLSPFCDEYGGAVLNVTIDRYAYAIIEPSNDGCVHFSAQDIIADEVLPARLPLVSQRLSLHAGVFNRMVGQFGNGSVPPIRLTTFVDAPPGSGLGSSSALVVAMVEVFQAFLGVPLGPYDVAHIAYEIERLELGLPGGKQDQYSAAFGGVNFIEFLAGDKVIVNPMRVPREILNEVEMSLLTCFSGVSRRSEEIILSQQSGMTAAVGNNLQGLQQLKTDAVEMKQALLRGEIEHMAQILARSWEAKKLTARGISTGTIEYFLEQGLAHGALAGKVSGAGGGGFIMFLVPPHKRVELIRTLRDAGGDPAPVHLTQRGAEAWTVYASPPDVATMIRPRAVPETETV